MQIPKYPRFIRTTRIRSIKAVVCVFVSGLLVATLAVAESELDVEVEENESTSLSPTVLASPSPVPSSSPSPKPTYHPRVERVLRLDDVIRGSSVKDQGQVGFCWAYATCGQAEAGLLQKGGKEVDLSEEWVGFWSLYEQILEMAPRYLNDMEKKVANTEGKRGVGRAASKVKTALGNALRSLGVQFFLHPSEGAPDMQTGLTLAKKYGLVPESIFSYKIIGDAAATSVENRIIDFINSKMRDPSINSRYKKGKDASGANIPNPETILEDLAYAYTLESTSAGPESKAGRLLSAYREGFSWEGKRYRADEFVSKYLEFNPDNYASSTVEANNFAASVRKVEAALSKKESVPLGMVLMNGFREAIKSGDGILSPETCGVSSPCQAAGGHAILIVGRTTDETGKTNGFLIKNSWGALGLNSSGVKTSGTDSGYQIVTLDYLKESYGPHPAAGETPSKFNWQVALPKESIKDSR